LLPPPSRLLLPVPQRQREHNRLQDKNTTISRAKRAKQDARQEHNNLKDKESTTGCKTKKRSPGKASDHSKPPKKGQRANQNQKGSLGAKTRRIITNKQTNHFHDCKITQSTLLQLRFAGKRQQL